MEKINPRPPKSQPKTRIPASKTKPMSFRNKTNIIIAIKVIIISPFYEDKKDFYHTGALCDPCDKSLAV
jgi:hypothetical protein